MPYLIDADVFIRAKNLHYGFDFCPGFWEWVEKGHDAGSVFSIEKVLDELRAGTDDLADWASAHSELFLPPTQPTLAALQQVSDWVVQQSYEATAIDTFLQSADYYLVAEALARGFDVVSHEIPANSVKRVKIPNACVGVRVKCLTPFEMLRIEGARFVLESAP